MLEVKLTNDILPLCVRFRPPLNPPGNPPTKKTVRVLQALHVPRRSPRDSD